MNSGQIYIRVKRRDKTYCLLCRESDTIAAVKDQLQLILKQFGSNDNEEGSEKPTLRLLHETSQKVLLDEETLADAKVSDNQVLHLVYCIDEEEEEFEPVEVVSTMPQQQQQQPAAAAAAATSTET